MVLLLSEWPSIKLYYLHSLHLSVTVPVSTPSTTNRPLDLGQFWVELCPPKKLCLNPNYSTSECDPIWRQVFTEVVKLEFDHLGGPKSSMTAILRKMGNLDTESEDSMKIHREKTAM